jgi:hypothetical protein
MRKLKLVFDELQVESFETSAASGEAGTVHGHDYTEYCPTEVCTGEFGLTCKASCGGTCDLRCFDTDEAGCIEPLPPARWSEYYVDGICAVS